MNLLKRILGGKKKFASGSDSMRGAEPIQTAEETKNIRDHMEAEMQAERERRESGDAEQK